jgi:hypothetical protein
MADDAGALLVRTGLVSSTALDDARSRVASVGGTLGEQLVASGAVADDALTDFYRQRLLVPQVNPNTLARLPHKVVASIPTDMAIELRAIPVSLDGENNLTVAMSDPSDRHAVDEIAFFTGTYVVRAVATQMQIAWCLAHYYGHVTTLGQRLIQPQSEPAPIANRAVAVGGRAARTKGLTGKVEATRHHAIAPGAAPIDARRPTSGELDRVALAAKANAEAEAAAAAPVPAAPERSPEPSDDAPRDRVDEDELEALEALDALDALERGDDGEPAAPEPIRAAESDRAGAAIDAANPPRTRSVSGEIRVPTRRAPSIRPPLPPLHEDDDESAGPVITLEAGVPDEDATGPRKVPLRRPAKSNPPELAARTGEVDSSRGATRAVEPDEPRIIVTGDDLVEPRPSSHEMSGEFRIIARPPTDDDQLPPASTIEVDDTAVGVVIHDYLNHDDEPVLLERRRPADPPDDETDDDVVVLEARKPQPTPPAAFRIEPRGRTTKVGMGAASPQRGHHDTDAMGVPAMIDDAPTDGTSDDPTRLDTRRAPPRHDDPTDETLAAPPRPASAEDSAPRAAPSSRRAPSIKPPAVTVDDDDDPVPGSVTAVMSVRELDEAIPQRMTDAVPAHLDFRDRPDRRTERVPRMIEPESDDGWGPPGTTIPPPLLGAMPGTGDDDDQLDSSAIVIPIANVDTAPLIVAPPSPPEPARGAPAFRDSSGPSLVRALEEAASRSLELIHALELAKDRDGVVSLMVAHLGETHRRAGFFSIKPGTPTTAGAAPRASELTVFSIEPVPAVIPVSALRLDQPSTLQDVVGTRLPYRGPMHDDASRNFLAAVLGSCPPEILLVPVAIRERVVGVLFGELRMRHTFDDQLALAARAAGMALERILKAKRA